MSDYIWVGLDVHVKSITAAILEGDSQEAEVVRLSGDLNKVRRLMRRLSEKGPVRACYEASGAGFVLHRRLKKDGFTCEVIAPSLIPRKPGDRRKCDRLIAADPGVQCHGIIAERLGWRCDIDPVALAVAAAHQHGIVTFRHQLLHAGSDICLLYTSDAADDLVSV
mgnify:CR=1 FL=1